MQGNLKVSHTRLGKVGGEERDLGPNVNAAELNHPPHHPNEVLVE